MVIKKAGGFGKIGQYFREEGQISRKEVDLYEFYTEIEKLKVERDY